MTEDKSVTDVTTEDDDDIDDTDVSKTAEYVKTLKAEAKKYRQDKATLKKEYEATQAKLAALEAEKLTDAEKKEKRIAELEKILADKDNAIKNKELDALITEAISDKGIVDKDVAKLLIRAELENEEDKDIKVVSKVVDKILKEKPYLIASNSANPSTGNFAKQTNEPTQDVDKLFGKMIRG
jgi:hypothetical protein